jgi:hypothetical protein
MEYQVVIDVTVHVLVKQVNSRIEQGWKPLGGVSVSSTGDFLQAMILEDKEDEDEQ